MKKYIHTLLAATTLAMAACSNDPQEPGIGTLPDGTSPVTIKANAGSREETRISYNEAADGSQTHILWSAQEQFALCYSGALMDVNYLFVKDDTEADVPSANFTYTGFGLETPPWETLYAVYPGRDDIMAGNTTITVDFATQTDTNCHLMIVTLQGSDLQGNWANANFTFRTRVALLKLTLTHADLAGQALTNITLQAAELQGQCQFTLAEDRWTSWNGVSNIAINTPITADASGTAILYVAQPAPGAPTGEITITATAGGKDYSGTLASGTFENYYIYTAPEITMAEVTPAPVYDYAVYTAEDLVALATAVNKTGGSDGNLPGTNIPARTARVIQMNDIDMSAISAWVPIGRTHTLPFAGTYNGGGYTITNLRTASNYSGDYAGFFGYVVGTASQDAVLTGIHLQGCNITSTYTGGNTGALAGATQYIVISGCSATGSVKGYYYTGGLIGNANGNTYITYSSSACTVTGEGTTGSSRTGGLVGDARISYIVACTASGQVTDRLYAGGLVGYSYEGAIAYSYATGTATSETGIAAGFIAISEYSTINNCYATGTPSGGAINNAFGGTTHNATIANCHPYGGNTIGTPGATVRTPYSIGNIKTVRNNGTDIEVITETFNEVNTWAPGNEDYPVLHDWI